MQGIFVNYIVMKHEENFNNHYGSIVYTTYIFMQQQER